MVKLTILFRKPADLWRFDDAYNAFLAAAEQMPGITRRQVNHVLGSPLGASPYERVLELYFADYAAMQASMTGAQGQAAGAALYKLAPGDFEMLFSEVYEEAGGSTPAAGERTPAASDT